MQSGLGRFARSCHSPAFRCLPWFRLVHEPGQALLERASATRAAFFQRVLRGARTTNRRAFSRICSAGTPPGKAEEPRRVETGSNAETALQRATMLRYDVANCIAVERLAALSSRDGRGGTSPGPLPHFYNPHGGVTATAEGDSAGGGRSGPSSPNWSWPRLAGVDWHAPCFNDDEGSERAECGRRTVGAQTEPTRS